MALNYWALIIQGHTEHGSGRKMGGALIVQVSLIVAFWQQDISSGTSQAVCL